MKDEAEEKAGAPRHQRRNRQGQGEVKRLHKIEER